MFIDDDWKEIMGQHGHGPDEFYDYHMPAMDFAAKDDIINECCKPGAYVLVAGEEGRDFAVSLAQKGCHVVLLYRSKDNIEFVKEVIRNNQLTSPIEHCVHGDIADMSFFHEGFFDVLIYYGLPLIKVVESQKEIARVLKDTGVLAIGVHKKMSFFETLLGAKFPSGKKEPDQWMVLHVGEEKMQNQAHARAAETNQTEDPIFMQDELDIEAVDALQEDVRALFSSNEFY